MWGVTLALSPIALAVLIGVHARQLRHWIPWLSLKRGLDPYAKNQKDWPDYRESFIRMLVMRRRLFDVRLKRVRLKRIARSDVSDMPEWIIFQAVYLDRDLRSRGGERTQVWDKLDKWLDVDGPSLPSGSSVDGYLKSRLNVIDPGFLAIDRPLLKEHVDMCMRWLDKNDPHRYVGDLSRKCLCRRIPYSEFESRYGEETRRYAGGKAVVLLNSFESDVERFKLRMLDGDEVREYVAGPAAGIALVRDGRVVDRFMTLRFHFAEPAACTPNAAVQGQR